MSSASLAINNREVINCQVVNLQINQFQIGKTSLQKVNLFKFFLDQKKNRLFSQFQSFQIIKNNGNLVK